MPGDGGWGGAARRGARAGAPTYQRDKLRLRITRRQLALQLRHELRPSLRPVALRDLHDDARVLALRVRRHAHRWLRRLREQLQHRGLNRALLGVLELVPAVPDHVLHELQARKDDVASERDCGDGGSRPTPRRAWGRTTRRRGRHVHPVVCTLRILPEPLHELRRGRREGRRKGGNARHALAPRRRALQAGFSRSQSPQPPQLSESTEPRP